MARLLLYRKRCAQIYIATGVFVTSDWLSKIDCQACTDEKAFECAKANTRIVDQDHRTISMCLSGKFAKAT